VIGDLAPERVAPLLETAWLGRSYRALEEVASTNDEAGRLADEGAPHGTVVLAERQTRGRGRLGRSWLSEAGESLTFSTILRPALAPSSAPLLGLAAAVGLREGIAPALPGGPEAHARIARIKWPNDLLVGGKKVGGLLLELRAEANRVRYVVLGIGINANQAHLPDPVAATATSLRLARGGEPVDRALLLAALLRGLERWIDTLLDEGRDPVLAEWHRHADRLGETVAVRSGGGTVRGVAVGLDPSGALRLRLADGSETTVLAGDLEV
jgi:BirA family transcriptional regulator, biotin operon repressor / biotin---[acetyl-CoA-carboxylase] ligase